MKRQSHWVRQKHRLASEIMLFRVCVGVCVCFHVAVFFRVSFGLGHTSRRRKRQAEPPLRLHTCRRRLKSSAVPKHLSSSAHRLGPSWNPMVKRNHAALKPNRKASIIENRRNRWPKRDSLQNPKGQGNTTHGAIFKRPTQIHYQAQASVCFNL